MQDLYDYLRAYADTDFYPFHMPGHKRNSQEMKFSDVVDIDITEIDGFDNLHNAAGIIKQSQHYAAELYDSQETRFLVGGSTAGLLAAVSGTVTKNGKILIARNCHKSVYNAVFLNELEISFLYPEVHPEYGICGEIQPEQVKECLKNDSRIEAVVITSPTYEGCCSDVKKIAEICHRYGVPLIVDQAHGAHFGFHCYFPDHAVHQNADIVIQSLHKTMPALTQTALIHLNGSLINRERIREYLTIYQTSSPSYVLMGSIAKCISMIKNNADELFEKYVIRLETLRKEMQQLKNIRLIGDDEKREASSVEYDKSKLVFFLGHTNQNGKQFYDIMREKYFLQFEMADSRYALAMTSIMDRAEGFKRLSHAVLSEDRKLAISSELNRRNVFYNKNKAMLSIYQAKNAGKKKCQLHSSENCISAEYIYLYPPGIPVVVPGEKIENDIIGLVYQYIEDGFDITGLDHNGMLWIIDE